ncbi:MAG: hypothetical protein KDD04_03470 [Sinomicrobium sp.]|nr:hypothetical protein [Sinomicrobium sp.]
MISSILDKRRPVNFIIIAGYLFLYLATSRYLLFRKAVSFFTVASDLWMLVLLMTTVFLADFIDRKNSLSGNNAYVLLLFTISISLFPEVLTDHIIIPAHFFVLLAMRRILSLSNEKQTRQKIFDAALWISAATLLYTWSVLYFIALYMAIILYTPKNYKNWVIPFIAFMAALIMRYTWFLWFETGADFLSVFRFKIQGLYITYSLTGYFIPFAFLTLTGFIATLAYGVRSVRKRTLKQTTGFLMIIALLTGISMVLFFGNAERTTLVFMMFPFSVFFANYLDRIKKKWIKEAVIWIFLLAPAAVLMLQLDTVR